jgi:uncharacterized Zn finger protein
MIKYIIDKKTKIACTKCGYKNEPFIIIKKQTINNEHMRTCKKCGTMITYDVKIQYEQTEPLKLLQEIRSEEDIVNAISEDI